KPSPRHRIEKPPFYAAWATPVIHDTRAGLRINARCQVIDMNGVPIPGLYCGGESAGGFSMHGLPRAICQGVIAGRNSAAEPEAKGQMTEDREERASAASVPVVGQILLVTRWFGPRRAQRAGLPWRPP